MKYDKYEDGDYDEDDEDSDDGEGHFSMEIFHQGMTQWGGQQKEDISEYENKRKYRTSREQNKENDFNYILSENNKLLQLERNLKNQSLRNYDEGYRSNSNLDNSVIDNMYSNKNHPESFITVLTDIFPILVFCVIIIFGCLVTVFIINL